MKREVHNAPNSKSARQLLEVFTLEEVAEILKISPEQVIALAKLEGFTLPNVVVVCFRTGRRFVARGWRGAYRKAQIVGLTDWGWWRAEYLAAWEEMNGRIFQNGSTPAE